MSTTVFVANRTYLVRNSDLNTVPSLKLYKDQLLFANQTSWTSRNRHHEKMGETKFIFLYKETFHVALQPNKTKFQREKTMILACTYCYAIDEINFLLDEPIRSSKFNISRIEEDAISRCLCLSILLIKMSICKCSYQQQQHLKTMKSDINHVLFV